jgi:hypothetical protein
LRVTLESQALMGIADSKCRQEKKCTASKIKLGSTQKHGKLAKFSIYIFFDILF